MPSHAGSHCTIRKSLVSCGATFNTSSEEAFVATFVQTSTTRAASSDPTKPTSTGRTTADTSVSLCIFTTATATSELDNVRAHTCTHEGSSLAQSLVPPQPPPETSQGGRPGATSWFMAMASVLLKMAKASFESLRMSEPMINGACRIHHMLNCVCCSTNVSGVWPFWLHPSHGRSTGQPTTRKSGSLKAPEVLTARHCAAHVELAN